jgi:glucosamine--fructose-6-phosphate aminotransferase (isomerizing)
MYSEAAEAGAVVRKQFNRNKATVTELGQRLRTLAPRAVATLARGSSDNAATYGRYLIDTHCGVLTSSIPPSIVSIYETTPAMEGMVLIALSQSGRSPDIVATARAAKARGALLVALVNDETSPLAAAADVLVPLCAGTEKSVAATKSFIAALAALLHVVAAWTNSDRLNAALDKLPGLLDRASTLDWSSALPLLRDAHSAYVIARGYSYGIAQEAALKMKETSGLHAEAFSAAEVRHGPMTLMQSGFPALVFGQADRSLDSVSSIAAELGSRDVPLMTAGLPTGSPGITLPTIDADPIIQPVLLIASFYRFANLLSLSRNHDPDRPPYLNKITETL